MGFEGFDWPNSNDVLEEGSRFSRGSRRDFHMVKAAAHREGKPLHQKLGEFGTNGIQGPVLMRTTARSKRPNVCRSPPETHSSHEVASCGLRLLWIDGKGGENSVSEAR